MSLLTPVELPVKVYRWDDAGAPVLDKTTGCISTILKTCLVTGYGNKEGAGWTVTHEDQTTKTKVFGFDDMAEPRFSLRLLNENTNTMGVQLVKDVVDANTATVVLECDTKFKFFNSKLTGEWMVIANERGFWFFAQILHTHAPANETGVFLFASIVPGMLSSAFILKHTGGTYGDSDPDRAGITTIGLTNASTKAAAIRLDNKQVFKGDFATMWNGYTKTTPLPIAAPLYLYGAGDAYQLPIYSPSCVDFFNFDIADLNTNAVNFCTSTQPNSTIKRENAYVLTDSWGS